MKNFDAYMSLAQGAVTKAGDNAARERVMLADAVMLRRSEKSLELIRRRRKRNYASTLGMLCGASAAIGGAAYWVWEALK